MQTHQDFFPNILFPDDLATISHAHRLAMIQNSCVGLGSDEVARIALHFYRLGLVDETKLAEITGLAARRLAGIPLADEPDQQQMKATCKAQM